MTRHFATALLIGMGFMPDLPVSLTGQTAGSADASQAAMRGVVPSTLIRRAAFGQMKCAGRFRREQIATFAYEEGKLWAEWAGHVQAMEPRRLETAELDAEWMAYTPSCGGAPARWMLTRRDLQPAVDGQFWSVLMYGSVQDPGSLQMIITADSPPAAQSRPAFSASFIQGPESVRLRFWPRDNGKHIAATELAAPNLARLTDTCPEPIRTILAPAVLKIAQIKLG